MYPVWRPFCQGLISACSRQPFGQVATGIHRPRGSTGSRGEYSRSYFPREGNQARIDFSRFTGLLPGYQRRRGAWLGYCRHGRKCHDPSLRACPIRSLRERRVAVLECIGAFREARRDRCRSPVGIAARTPARRHRIRYAIGSGQAPRPASEPRIPLVLGPRCRKRGLLQPQNPSHIILPGIGSRTWSGIRGHDAWARCWSRPRCAAVL